MTTWSFDTCKCSFEVDREFNFVKAVNVCDGHFNDDPAISFKDAHNYNMQINIQKAKEEIEE